MAASSSSREVPTGLEGFNYLDIIDTSDNEGDGDKIRKGPSEPWSKNVLVSRHVVNLPKIDGTAIEVSTTETEQQPLAAVRAMSDLRHPTVLWKQTDQFIILHVDIQDVKDYSLTIDNSSKLVSFRTVDPENYGFEFNSLGAFAPAPELLVFGQNVQIKLTKKSRFIWPRLTKEVIKYRWLKQYLDLDEMANDDDEFDDALERPCNYEDDSDDSDTEVKDSFLD